MLDLAGLRRYSVCGILWKCLVLVQEVLSKSTYCSIQRTSPVARSLYKQRNQRWRSYHGGFIRTTLPGSKLSPGCDFRLKRTYTLSPAGPGARPGSCTAPEAAHQALSDCCLTNRQKFTPTSRASHGRKDADVSIPLVVSYIGKEITKLLDQASCWDNENLLCTFLGRSWLAS
jgi:hypothetical protein